jgi:hypothetical protein
MNNLRKALKRHKQFTSLKLQLSEQRKWIADHGATLDAYVDRYGKTDDPNKYGDGGSAIYAADMGELARIEQKLLDQKLLVGLL